MSDLLLLALAWLIALVINFVPAFMPPTWSVLAVFHVTTDVPLLLLTVGGAAASAVGRVGLALLSARLRRFLPESDARNAEALGQFVNRHRRWREAIFFTYCLAPFPSNPLFIAAGVGRLPLLPVTVAFFLSRAIADTFWVWTAGQASKSLSKTFESSLTDWRFIAIQAVSLVVVVGLFRLPWAKWLGMDDSPGAQKKRAEATRGAA